MLPLLRGDSSHGSDESSCGGIFAVRVGYGRPGSATVHLRGELDFTCTTLLDAVLRRHSGYRTVYLDLAELNFLDCTGVDSILAAHERQRRRSGRLVLIHAGPVVRRVLELTRADRVLPMADTALPDDRPGTT